MVYIRTLAVAERHMLVPDIEAMQDELKDIQRHVGTTFVHVTHDQEEAMAKQKIKEN